ncbi:MAG: helix-turn-helix transcriptional regulator [Nitrospirae bacterium]|nr:helix-turn-helix transcriptional regulator [Nitrospirota bacterium]
MARNNLFGEFFKSRRLSLGKTLRQFCIDCRLDALNISKMERGMFPPPTSHDKLEEYAKLLRIEEGSSEWYEFFDLAQKSAEHIAAEFCLDEDTAGKLPIFFRTITGQRLTEGQLDKLAETLQDA